VQHLTLITYEAVYGFPPPRLLTYVPGTTQVDAVDEVLHTRQQILTLLQHNLQQAQQRMKKYSDLKCTERSFEVGQMVYLRLQPYKQSSVAARQNLKLSPRFYGPFTILRKIGIVACELDLPLHLGFTLSFMYFSLSLSWDHLLWCCLSCLQLILMGFFVLNQWRCWLVELGLGIISHLYS
jgi:hypothetical protein